MTLLHSKVQETVKYSAFCTQFVFLQASEQTFEIESEVIIIIII